MALTLSLARFLAFSKPDEEELVVREAAPDPIAEYLAAFNELELVGAQVQALVDRLHRVAFVLGQAGASAGQNDGWKLAHIAELNRPPVKRSALRWQVSLETLPTAAQLQEAIALWHVKRDALSEKWNRLNSDVQKVLKSPSTLD